MNTELTAKQIARIERIRAERAERIVDQRDSPNVAPYKKCAFCHERSSCGNYTNDDQWKCESCDDNRECCEMCGDKTSHEVWTDYNGDEVLYCDDCYYRNRVRIEQKCPECRFRQRCPNLSICGAPNTNLCAICDPDEE